MFAVCVRWLIGVWDLTSGSGGLHVGVGGLCVGVVPCLGAVGFGLDNRMWQFRSVI